ncbi:MAG TPA: hypothetical protein VGE85_11400 [Terracidiphilus sp.]|jgi:hypothetical protein
MMRHKHFVYHCAVCPACGGYGQSLMTVAERIAQDERLEQNSRPPSTASTETAAMGVSGVRA